jgi:hypothetical protein
MKYVSKPVFLFRKPRPSINASAEALCLESAALTTTAQKVRSEDRGSVAQSIQGIVLTVVLRSQALQHGWVIQSCEPGDLDTGTVRECFDQFDVLVRPNHGRKLDLVLQLKQSRPDTPSATLQVSLNEFLMLSGD